MNPEIKAKWIAALRSGDYKQGRNQLRKQDSFCCLGVLCNLHAQAHPEIAAKEISTESYMDYREALPPSVRQWADINAYGDPVHINGRIKRLAHHNDAGRTFLELADAIEAQL